MTRAAWSTVAMSAELHRRAAWFEKLADRTGHPGRADRYYRLSDIFHDTATDLTCRPSPQAERDARALLTITFRRNPT